MKKKDIAIILGFIFIILASTIPLINTAGWVEIQATYGYTTIFEAIKIKILVMIT